MEKCKIGSTHETTYKQTVDTKKCKKNTQYLPLNINFKMYFFHLTYYCVVHVKVTSQMEYHSQVSYWKKSTQPGKYESMN